MEELPKELLEELERQPARKRQTKRRERTYKTWFYDCRTTYGSCDNPNCIDPRGSDTAMVWTEPTSTLNMCRFCFLDGWLED